MIAPGGDEEFAAVFLREGGGIKWDNLAGGFAGAVNHGEGAAQFAIPGKEGMDAGSAVFVAVAVVAILHNVQQPAGRAVAGVIVHGENAAPIVYAHAEWIPKSARDLLQFFTIHRAAEHASADAFGPFDFFAVGTDHHVGMPQVFPEAENEISFLIKTQSAEAVVRVGAGGFHHDNILGLVCLAVAGGVLHPQDAAAFCKVYPVVSADRGVHAHVESLIKNRPFRFAIGLGGEHQHAITLGALIILRTKVGVTLDDNYPALSIYTDTGGGDNIWGLSDQFDDDALVGRFGRVSALEAREDGGSDEV